MSKKPRGRPFVQANNAYIRQDEHQKCQTKGCQNVVAQWTGHRHCTPCREAGKR